MKKISIISLVLILALTLSACGSKSPVGASDAVDIDLTQLSSTMAYSEVTQMANDPGEYKGETVKMTGLFAIDEGEKRNYYACQLFDVTACCSTWLEFEWAGKHSYPEDYPELGSEITVVGTLDTYKEYGNTYVQLSNATLIF